MKPVKTIIIHTIDYLPLRLFVVQLQFLLLCPVKSNQHRCILHHYFWYNFQQISAEVGSQWYEFIDETHAYENPWYTYYPRREVLAHHDSIELPNGTWFYDVLQIGQSNFLDGKDGESPGAFYHLYYANEIGLIWENNLSTPSYSRYLEEYYIAPH